MFTYKCPHCGKLQYSASENKENEPCIFCGHSEVELVDWPEN